MNIRANNFVRSLRGLSPQEKSVAYTIASHADYLKCECTASMSTIATESGFKNRETASRITKRLEIDYGVIKAVGAHSGGKIPTTYTFTMEVNRDCGITVAVSREGATVTQDKSNRDSDEGSTVTGIRPTVTQNASTVTGESHEGIKVFEGTEKSFLHSRNEGKIDQSISFSKPKPSAKCNAIEILSDVFKDSSGGTPFKAGKNEQIALERIVEDEGISLVGEAVRAFGCNEEETHDWSRVKCPAGLFISLIADCLNEAAMSLSYDEYLATCERIKDNELCELEFRNRDRAKFMSEEELRRYVRQAP